MNTLDSNPHFFQWKIQVWETNEHLPCSVIGSDTIFVFGYWSMREIWSQVFSKTTKAFQEWQKVCISKISFASQCFFLLNSRLQRADAKQKNAGRGSSNGDSHESLSDEDSKECGSQTTNYSSWIKNIRTIAEQKSHQKYTIKNWVSDFCFCKKNHQLQQNSSITYPEGLLLDSRRWILLSWFKRKVGIVFHL